MGEIMRERQSPSDILENARKSRCGYDKDATRESLTVAVKLAFMGMNAGSSSWILRRSVLVMLGLDVTAIAGTGSGKTLPWVVPLLLEESKTKTKLIVSP